MGASISFDSKYRLILDTEVECISTNTPTDKKKSKHSRGDGRKRDSDSESGSESGSDSGSESGSESGSGSDNGRDSDGDNKTYTVKITPEITNYIRSYLRKNQFLDEFDLITEMDLVEYSHAPDSALVFNSDSIVFNPNNQTIEAVGEWEYLESEKPVVSSSSTHKKSKSKSKGSRHRDDDNDNDNDGGGSSNDAKYKTKDDELPVGEIESVLKTKFEEYNKTREFVIHESKNSFLVMLIKSVEIVKA